jgi:hypothetical protein
MTLLHGALSVRGAARAAVAARASGLGSLRELTSLFRDHTMGGNPKRDIARDEFDDLVAAAYPPEDELGSAAAAAAVTQAFDAARRNAAAAAATAAPTAAAAAAAAAATAVAAVTAAAAAAPAASAAAATLMGTRGYTDDSPVQRSVEGFGVNYDGFLEACRAHPTIGRAVLVDPGLTTLEFSA